MNEPGSPNPLLHATTGAWDQLIAALNPPTMLVAIRGMMGKSILARCEPDDIWQETLLQAWRSRARFEWRGSSSFRRWLLEIARNRIRDLANSAATKRHGGDAVMRGADPSSTLGSHSDDHYAGPSQQTTPGRAAADREIAAHFEGALAALPDDWREVVRMRLFEDLTLEEIAQRLAIGIEGARYRFRHGAECYRRELRRRRVLEPSTSEQDS